MTIAVPSNMFDAFVGCSSREPVSMMLVDNYERVPWLCEQLPYHRFAQISLQAAAFGGAQFRHVYVIVGYADCLKFNIVPPTLKKFQAVQNVFPESSFDVTKGGSGEDCYKYNVRAKVPIGWSYEQMLRFRPKELGDMIKGMHKLCWCTMAPLVTDKLIHPALPRTITLREARELVGVSYPTSWQELRSTVPMDLLTWVMDQCASSECNEWGDSDWESRYSFVSRQWIGQDTTKRRVKHFNLVEYYTHPKV